MSVSASPVQVMPDQFAEFLALVAGALQQNTFVKLVLARPVATDVELERVIVKRLVVKDQPCLTCVYRYKTRDITRNFALAEGQLALAELMPGTFRNAHLLTLGEEWQLEFRKKGKTHLRRNVLATDREAQPEVHDREKKRFLELSRPFLRDLGVTDAQQQLIPSMSRKWKQINKFIEVFAHAFATARLGAQAPVRVADFGSGKGYLTFAIHDYLSHTLERDAQVTGVELREDMVALCNTAAASLKSPGLVFEHGDVRTVVPSDIDVMIALHACDIATDYAIHTGIRTGAAIIMCSPCCHKQIRLQIQSPDLLRPMLQYGLHLGQQAEMVTDSLRALYLEACGYETKVFEFISLEHTNKNKMILAIKRAEPHDPTVLLEKIRALKEFYAITEHCLEGLLQADNLLPGALVR